MDRQCSLEKRTGFGPEFGRRAAETLMSGVLLGMLVGFPYTRWLGLSDTLAFALRSVIATVALSGLIARWPAEMTLEQTCFL